MSVIGLISSPVLGAKDYGTSWAENVAGRSPGRSRAEDPQSPGRQHHQGGNGADDAELGGGPVRAGVVAQHLNQQVANMVLFYGS
jgi:hypothetical protein